MEKERVNYMPYVDVLKGIAIFLMVMAHAIAWSFKDYTFLSKPFFGLTDAYGLSSIVWKVIYSFHMPLLFFASGYLLEQQKWTTSITVQIVYSTIIAAISISISFIITKTISSNKILRLILFGKK